MISLRYWPTFLILCESLQFSFVATKEQITSIKANLSYSFCTDDLDCSLNGLCDKLSNQCICDKPWGGNECELLQFLPVTFPQGYGMTPNVTTWGGGIIHDNGTHHLYVSRMTNNCALNTWGENSRIDHAISTTGPTGPYFFHDVAINTFSHNAAPVVLPYGTYALFHIGSGEGGPEGPINCTEQQFLDLEESRFLRKNNLEFDHSHMIHISTSLYGPWKPIAPENYKGCNNPAPWIHPNGTIYVGCGRTLKRADNISGPYFDIATFPISGGPDGNYEDAQIYTDQRGNFHSLYHVYARNGTSFNCTNSLVSAHAYSRDGLTWNISKYPPYGTQVLLSSGETITVATRERPKPFFSATGKMTHLVQGVCGSPFCAPPRHSNQECVNCKYDQWDFTLVSPLDIA
mmetsp:Transcript_16619/g.25112  ORF Transcript_16619/g.25112 Transcript_16619/m.25112 type:complete len:403 (-) Transcript_16619:2071-3279(-)